MIANLVTPDGNWNGDEARRLLQSCVGEVEIDASALMDGFIAGRIRGEWIDDTIAALTRRGWRVVLQVREAGEIEPWHKAHPRAIVEAAR